MGMGSDAAGHHEDDTGEEDVIIDMDVPDIPIRLVEGGIKISFISLYFRQIEFQKKKYFVESLLHRSSWSREQSFLWHRDISCSFASQNKATW